MQKSWSSSFLWPIHPTQPRAQSSSKAGAGCLPQGSTATQTSASFLIQDKILNALKTKSGQHLGAKLRNASSEFLCSLLHTQNLGCPSDATQIVLPIPRFVQSLLPTPASTQFCLGLSNLGASASLTQSTSQTTHGTFQSQGGFPAANVTLPLKFMHCIANKSASRYLKHSAGLKGLL